MSMIHFHGYELIIAHIQAVGPVKSFSVGSLAYEVVYGFKIYLQGTVVKFKMPYDENGSLKFQKERAQEIRKELIKLINDNYIQ